ncbi:MAG: murein hydrolase transporter LrgA [Acidiphilium sp. 37-67-22]|nr:MAG: murein hydrolase transporter LrgA [Acidiphilium sp. 21-66-27]OYW12620.1 MAG: murein hydrolase transporter LrgA [Acidiphilium sp. 37-67-22]HQT74897.1 CidA/LrgA family protein [Acidiphilium sp.]
MRRIAEFRTNGLARAGRLAAGFAVVLGCFDAGSAVAPLLPVKLPGALAGMVILAALLARHRGRAAVAASEAGALLLRRYALFFVPAGVGVMTGAGALWAAWPAVVAALVVSSLLALTVTGLTMRLMLRLRPPPPRTVLPTGCGHD